MSTTEVDNVTADLGTRSGEAYPPAGEVLLSGAPVGGGATNLEREDAGALDERSAVGGFASSREQFDAIVGWMEGVESDGLEHSELKERLQSDGRELLRRLLQDKLELRAVRERRLDEVVDAAGVVRGAVESGHQRPLQSVFGEVRVKRLAYRRRGEENLYVADGALNLPEEKHSHGLRRLVALDVPRGSCDDATETIRRITAAQIGKRQVEELALRAAVDFEAFYEQRERGAVEEGDALVLSCDGKGVVMRAEALRPQTKRQAESSENKLQTRLSRGEKRGRKRIAEVAAVYEVTPQVRTAADILPATEQERETARAGPEANNKWLSASVTDDAVKVIARMFEEADRRDPEHQRSWVALVDGNRHQIDRIKKEAKKRGVAVTITVDFVHVMEYLWASAWCFFKEGDPAAERWVAEKLRAVLAGNASTVAAAIRRKATRLGLDQAARKNADRAAAYLLAKRPYLDYPTALTNERVANRDRSDRGRLSPPDQRPHGYHRRALGAPRRRSRAETTRPQEQRRLRRVLALPPRTRAQTNPPSALCRRDHPLQTPRSMTSLQESCTQCI
jgi:hypothetical protein